MLGAVVTMTQQRRIRAAAAGAIFALATLALGPTFLASSAAAQSAANPTDVLARADQPSFTFTFRDMDFTDTNTNVWSGDFSLPALELSAGDKWGFTFGLQNSDGHSFDLDGVRAGAFFDITPRVRVGGALSFTDSDAFFAQGSDREDIPEVKFESAFKF